MYLVKAIHPAAKRNPAGARFSFDHRDIINVPVKHTGTFTLMDMLNDSSLRNTIQAYNAMKGK